MSKRHNRGMWEYLESIPGLLEKGNDLEIKAHKATYRKKYLLEYKRKQRGQRDEFNIGFLKGSQDYDLITQGAKKHSMSIPAMLRSATLAYLRRTFVVPNRGQIAQMEQMLGDCLNEIKAIAHQKSRYRFDWEDKCLAVEKRLERLESEINEYLCQPLPVEEFVKRAVAKDPTLKDELLAILSLSLPDGPKTQNSQ